MLSSLKTRIGLLVSFISFMVHSVSASTVTSVAAGASATMTGSLGLLVDLGIENVPGVTTAQAKFYYNIISFALVIWLAWVADEPSSAEFGVLCVGVSALTAWFGWFTTPNPVGQWGLIIMCAVITVILYMTEKKRMLFGINGAGDPLIQILVFILLFQATIGLVNGTGIFEAGQTVATPADCANNVYTNCTINGNVQLANIGTNTGTNSNIVSSTFSYLTTIVTVGWNILVLIIELLVSVSCFAYVLYSTYPWIASSATAVIFVGILQLGIWLIYFLAIFRYIWKPMPQDGRM